MADIQDATSPTMSREASASAQQEANRTEAQRHSMQATGQEMRHKAQELTAQGKEVAAEYYQQGRERVLEWQQKLEQQARQKPLQTIIMAAGIGLLLGLLRRR
jgi:ElaB/YqjD/DUF883 family membrane-anchored ribosome-binding protein